ncbi:MAG: tRNA 2-thiouridine(34) synthase MnmA [Erysipelotrichaceae bacterium]|nr:tRNA 2-thiouridine(34) synthase MnmA [Erysipelotrichaceae bacterium]
MKKILLGLSGGVDSAVAAWILKEQGYDVTCAFMRNWDSAANDDILGNPTLDEEICTQEQDYNDAKAVCEILGLPLLRADFIEEYWQDVFMTFLQEYRRGRTPNPDILCNKYIKFSRFIEFGRAQGFDLFATGHYAANAVYQGNPVIARPKDTQKDQTYFLAQIDRNIIGNVVFPLGSLDKTEVRKIAEQLGLGVARKKDSTGICFIGERDFRAFLSNYLPMKPGRIINIPDKRVVGEHKGVLYYTIGQRKGLDIGGTGPYYVIGKDVERNELYVTDEAHTEWLYSDTCDLIDMNLHADLPDRIECTAKFRYRQKDQQAVLIRDEQGYHAQYQQGVRSVTPGQEAVFWLGDILLGGGVIDRIYRNGTDLEEAIKQQRP